MSVSGSLTASRPILRFHFRTSRSIPTSVSNFTHSIEHHCNFQKSNSSGLADQIRRASKSICGNIAEGYGKRRRSRAEFKRYLLMAIGSADEMQVWLRYCSDLEYIDQKSCAQWRNEYRQLARVLQGLYTTLSSSSDP